MAYKNSEYINLFKNIAHNLIPINGFVQLRNHEFWSNWNQGKLKDPFLILELPDTTATNIKAGNHQLRLRCAFNLAATVSPRDFAAIDKWYDQFDEIIPQIVAELFLNVGDEKIFISVDDNFEIMDFVHEQKNTICSKRVEFTAHVAAHFFKNKNLWLSQ